MNLTVLDLGLIGYEEAWKIQKEMLRQVTGGFLKAALLLCSHYPVITAGRQAKPQNILASRQNLRSAGLSLYNVERGGDVTYHGPGQVTAYPIVNLALLRKDIHWFLRQLERITISCLRQFGIEGCLRPGLTGVWVDKFKVASIGISIKKWVTFHGLSINVGKDDLANFNLIRPCGMDIKMAALETFSPEELSIGEVKKALVGEFSKFYSYNIKKVIARRPQADEAISKTEVVYA